MKLLTVIASVIVSVSVNSSSCKNLNAIKFDGRGSTAAAGIKSFHWFQVSGPSTVFFDFPDSSVVNASSKGATAGTYIIGLAVTDKAGQVTTGTATVNLTK